MRTASQTGQKKVVAKSDARATSKLKREKSTKKSAFKTIASTQPKKIVGKKSQIQRLKFKAKPPAPYGDLGASATSKRAPQISQRSRSESLKLLRRSLEQILTLAKGVKPISLKATRREYL